MRNPAASIACPCTSREPAGAEPEPLGVKAMEGAKNLDVQRSRTRRRMGSGTATQPTTEQERSRLGTGTVAAGCHPAVPGKGEAYKRRPREVAERRAEVGGGHTVAMKAWTE